MSNPILPVRIHNSEGESAIIPMSPPQPIPLSALDVRQTLIFPLEDSPGKPTRELIELALKVLPIALDVSLEEISARIPDPIKTPDTWPGQHYRLLAALVKFLQPKLIIEIGTASGYSALALKKFLPAGSRIVTFDVVPWKEYPGAILKEEDFTDGRLIQKVADLTKPHIFSSFSKLISQADLMFVDAAKDGVMEQIFLNHFETVMFENDPYVVFDDIRLWNMLAIWRGIDRPKLDLTSFGSWSGTGLIHWTPRE